MTHHEISENRAIETEASERIRALFLRDKEALRRFLVRTLKPYEDTEDVIQEVYLRLLKQQAKTPDKDFSRSYLFVIATNIIRDKRRHEWVQRRAGHEPLSKESEYDQTSDPYPTAEAQIVWRDGLSIVKQALTSLKPNHAEVFLLHWGQGLTMVEISKRTGIPVRSVERYASHALSHCKDALKRRDW